MGDADVVGKESRIREARAWGALSWEESTELEYQVHVHRVVQILSRREVGGRVARASGARGAVLGGERRERGGRQQREHHLLPRPRLSLGSASAHGEDKERIGRRRRRLLRRYLATHRTRRDRRLSSSPGLLEAWLLWVVPFCIPPVTIDAYFNEVYYIYIIKITWSLRNWTKTSLRLGEPRIIKKGGDKIGWQSVMLHGSSHKLNFNLLYQVKELIMEYLLYSKTNFTRSQIIVKNRNVEFNFVGRLDKSPV